MALHQRITAKECIKEYEQAAREHQNAGRTLLAGGNALGVALMAFSAEMALKAAYFRFIGYTSTQQIEMAHLRDARADVAPLDVDLNDYHNLLLWAEALIAVRKRGLPSRTYGVDKNRRSYSAVTVSPVDHDAETELRRCATRLMDNWSVSDRYKSIQSLADPQDMEDVLNDASLIIQFYDVGKV